MKKENKLAHLIKITLIGVIILLTSNSSCKKEDINGIKMVEFNTNFELAINEKAQLGIESKELIIDLKQVADSRCPVDVECIWAGNVRVSLNLYDLEKNNSEAILCLGQCDGKFKIADTTIVNLNQTNYTVVLKEVKSYPESTGSYGKKATLLIRKD